jgi:Fur family transcriptional regulator, ferric uptake regulator
VEFFSPEIEKVEKEIGRKHRFVTTSHTFQVYGLCADCQKKKAGRRK